MTFLDRFQTACERISMGLLHFFLSEINELKQNLVHALEAKSGSQEERLSLVQKSSEMSSELVALQSKLKDEEQKRLSLEKSCEGMKVSANCILGFIILHLIASLQTNLCD